MSRFYLAAGSPFDLNGDCLDDEIADNVKGAACISDDHRQLLSDDAIDLIEKLLEKDPHKRISADEMLKHPWFSMNEQGSTPSEECEDLCA